MGMGRSLPVLNVANEHNRILPARPLGQVTFLQAITLRRAECNAQMYGHDKSNVNYGSTGADLRRDQRTGNSLSNQSIVISKEKHV